MTTPTLMSSKLPRYASVAIIRREVAEFSRARLMEFARQGFVRTVKLGEARQTARLYNTEDVLGLLDRLATGRMPRHHMRAAVRSRSRLGQGMCNADDESIDTPTTPTNEAAWPSA